MAWDKICWLLVMRKLRGNGDIGVQAREGQGEYANRHTSAEGESSDLILEGLTQDSQIDPALRSETNFVTDVRQRTTRERLMPAI